MNKYRKYIVSFFFTVVISLLIPAISSAQPIDPGCDPLDPACPIDSGLSFLIAAGLGISAKKIYDLKNKENKQV